MLVPIVIFAVSGFEHAVANMAYGESYRWAVPYVAGDRRWPQMDARGVPPKGDARTDAWYRRPQRMTDTPRLCHDHCCGPGARAVPSRDSDR